MKSRSAKGTLHLGKELGERHPRGGLFYLVGDLGAGKTIFAKGLASAYGVPPDEVTSPTFALVHRYGEGSRPVYHVDLYRLENERELEELGLEELLDEEGVVLIVEWAEKLGRLRRPDAVLVEISFQSETARCVTIKEKLE